MKVTLKDLERAVDRIKRDGSIEFQLEIDPMGRLELKTFNLNGDVSVIRIFDADIQKFPEITITKRLD